MADTTAPVTTTTLDPSVQAAAQDVLDAIPQIQALVAALKTGGLAGVAAQAPALIAEAEKDFTDIKAAIPVVKTGYKTTEFWLVVAVFLGNGAYTMVTKKTLPVDLNVVLAAVVAVYTAARALVKGTAPAPVVPPVVKVPAAPVAAVVKAVAK